MNGGKSDGFGGKQFNVRQNRKQILTLYFWGSKMGSTLTEEWSMIEQKE